MLVFIGERAAKKLCLQLNYANKKQKANNRNFQLLAKKRFGYKKYFNGRVQLSVVFGDRLYYPVTNFILQWQTLLSVNNELNHI